MKEISEQPRSNFLDNIKGILIFLVVLGHFTCESMSHSTINSFITTFIYSFHMPAFIFISGYLSKSKNSNKLESILKLLIAYIFFIAPFAIYNAVTKNQINIITPYYSEWYLMALIFWRLLTPYLSKFQGITPILFVVAILSGFLPDLGGNFTLSITKIITFYPFFMLGYLFKEEKLEKIKNKKTSFKISFSFLFFILFSALFLLSYALLDLNINDLLPNTYSSTNLQQPLVRIIFFTISLLFICFILNCSTNKKIPLLTKIGKNSFCIYLFHRPITFIIKLISPYLSSPLLLLISLIFTIFIVFCFGSNFISSYVNKFFNNCAKAFSSNTQKNKNIYRTIVCSILCIILVLPIFSALPTQKISTQQEDKIYRVMSTQTKSDYDNSFKLLFCGDLILLEDQVKRGYKNGTYDFTENFEYTKQYISSADLSIGVFEGPMSTDQPYSTSNYDDNKELLLNFPEEWGYAIKDAGFDLVSTSNNHAMDRGITGLNNTIDALNNMNLDFIGTYKDIIDKQNNNVKIIEKDGLKIAVLAYTTWVNNTNIESVLKGDLSYITSMIVDKNHKYFESIKNNVKSDFEKAKQQNPDLIVVLPHWGTQFADYPDSTQLLWENIFKDYGADIILGDHTHSVQPIKINTSSKNTFTLYSPGNYANIYRDYNGDYSAMVEVYIDKSTKKVIGGSIIPMWTASNINGNYRPLPIYDILNNEDLAQTLTTYDLDRVEKAHKHITKIMLGEQLDLNMIQQKYYFDEYGFMRTKTANLEISDAMKQTETYQLISQASNVCFVGDSVTEGNKNGGVPWYEPLEHIVNGKVYNCGWGSSTTKTIINSHLSQIINTPADLFVIAIGTNDVRYRNSQCSLTSQEYIKNLQKIKDAILSKNPFAKFIFVAPWTSTDGDTVSSLSYKEKILLNNEYTLALSNWANSSGDCFVNPNIYIDSILDKHIHKKYLVDHIHPNATEGVNLYSYAFFQ